jgi:hypothetical protein
MTSKLKSPVDLTISELARIAADASREAGRQAREAGIEVTAIDVPERVPDSKDIVKKRA